MVGKLSRCLLMAALFNISIVTTGSADAGRPPAFDRQDGGASSYPWTSIGKVFSEAGNTCTGVIVSREKVLTAAHCIFNSRTQRFVGPDSLHFVWGYRGGGAVAQARVASYEIGSGYDPARWLDTLESDWVVLVLADSLPAHITPLKLSEGSLPSGTKALFVGFAKDRPHAITAESDCELRGAINDGRLIVHNCRSMQGYSGAPILVSTGDAEFQVAGIHIATARGDGMIRRLAVPAQAIARHTQLGPTSVASLPPPEAALVIETGL